VRVWIVNRRLILATLVAAQYQRGALATVVFIVLVSASCSEQTLWYSWGKLVYFKWGAELYW